MTDAGPYPDMEAALVELLGDLAPASHVGTVTPPDLQDTLPYIRVQRYGGNDDRVTDAAMMSVDCFDGTRAAAYSLAEQVRQRMLSYPHTTALCVIDAATTVLAPNEVPWSTDQTVRRFAASYRVSARRAHS